MVQLTAFWRNMTILDFYKFPLLPILLFIIICHLNVMRFTHPLKRKCAVDIHISEHLEGGVSSLGDFQTFVSTWRMSLTSKTCWDISDVMSWINKSSQEVLLSLTAMHRTVFEYSQWIWENLFAFRGHHLYRFPMCKFSSLVPDFH